MPVYLRDGSAQTILRAEMASLIATSICIAASGTVAAVPALSVVRTFRNSRKQTNNNDNKSSATCGYHSGTADV